MEKLVLIFSLSLMIIIYLIYQRLTVFQSENFSNMKKLQIFIVHHPPLIERKKFLLAQFDKEKIKNYNFIENEEFGDFTFDRFDESVLKKSEISLFLKHIYIYNIINNINNSYDYTLILEDDVILENNFLEKLYKYISLLPNDFDMLFLGDCQGLHVKSITPGPNVYFMCDNTKNKDCTRCADSILVNKNCAKKIIDYLSEYKDKIKLPIDFWLNEMALNKNNLKIYWAEPTIVKQGSETGQFKSSIR